MEGKISRKESWCIVHRNRKQVGEYHWNVDLASRDRKTIGAVNKYSSKYNNEGDSSSTKEEICQI